MQDAQPRLSLPLSWSSIDLAYEQPLPHHYKDTNEDVEPARLFIQTLECFLDLIYFDTEARSTPCFIHRDDLEPVGVEVLIEDHNTYINNFWVAMPGVRMWATYHALLGVNIAIRDWLATARVDNQLYKDASIIQRFRLLRQLGWSIQVPLVDWDYR